MKEQQTKNPKKYILITCIILIILIIASAIIYLIKTDKIKIQTSKPENTTLNHTQTAVKDTEGIVITDVSDIVEEVMPSIVAITSKTLVNSGQFGPSYFSSNQYTEGAGSGVIISEDENEIYIVTNYHVVENSNELTIKFIDEKSYDASIKGVSERKDIAVVSVTKNNIDSETLKQIKIATIGNSDELKVGNGIIAIGNALGYGQSVTTGVISALNREVSTDEYVQSMIQIDAAINGGNSGGALLNNKGQVIGINTAKYSDTSSSTSIEGMGFAIPISNVESTINDLVKGKNDKSVSLGIEGLMTSSIIQDSTAPTGFYIVNIESGSNAEKAGLEIGNIITKADDTQITSVNDLKKVINQKNTSEQIKLEISYASGSKYKQKTIKVTLN